MKKEQKKEVKIDYKKATEALGNLLDSKNHLIEVLRKDLIERNVNLSEEYKDNADLRSELLDVKFNLWFTMFALLISVIFNFIK